jgi:hypothetical protein
MIRYVSTMYKDIASRLAHKYLHSFRDSNLFFCLLHIDDFSLIVSQVPFSSRAPRK